MEAYKFPDELEPNNGSKEDDFDIEVIDDTPSQDRGRKPLDREVDDPSEAHQRVDPCSAR